MSRTHTCCLATPHTTVCILCASASKTGGHIRSLSGYVLDNNRRILDDQKTAIEVHRVMVDQPPQSAPGKSVSLIPNLKGRCSQIMKSSEEVVSPTATKNALSKYNLQPAGQRHPNILAHYLQKIKKIEAKESSR